jgi:hypothetical protein
MSPVLTWRRLSAEASTRKLPVAITTASPQWCPQRDEEARVEVLREPFTLHQIVSAVEHAMRRVAPDKHPGEHPGQVPSVAHRQSTGGSHVRALAASEAVHGTKGTKR